MVETTDHLHLCTMGLAAEGASVVYDNIIPDEDGKHPQVEEGTDVSAQESLVLTLTIGEISFTAFKGEEAVAHVTVPATDLREWIVEAEVTLQNKVAAENLDA